MTKQQRIESLEKDLEWAYDQIKDLKAKANDGFKASTEYNRMQQELHSLHLMQDLSEQHIETEIKQDKRLLDSVLKIRNDNVQLCAEHGAEYWEGMTSINKYDYKDVRDLEKKVTDLEAKVKAKDIVIDHLKSILYGTAPEEPIKRAVGRKPVPEEQQKSVRSYRKQGWTLKDIAEMEGLSLGKVSGICKGIKIKKNSESV